MNNLASVLAVEPKASEFELYSSDADELARVECRAKLRELVDHIRAHKCKGHPLSPEFASGGIAETHSIDASRASRGGIAADAPSDIKAGDLAACSVYLAALDWYL